MQIQKILITPSSAAAYLEANIKNRAVKQPTLLRYVSDMAAGRWKADTGEMIKISKTGVILDGQHRLMAVVKSKTNVYFHVITDLEDSVFDVLDTGSMRNGSDVFNINGVKYNSVLPAMIQLYEFLKTNRVAVRGTQKNNRHTNAVLLTLYNEDPLFWDNVAKKSYYWYAQFARVLNTHTIGGMYATFSDINQEDADNFMQQLCSGLNITNNTIGLLRNKIIQDRLSVKKMDIGTRNNLIIKTWNNFRKGTELTLLKFDADREATQIPK